MKDQSREGVSRRAFLTRSVALASGATLAVGAVTGAAVAMKHDMLRDDDYPVVPENKVSLPRNGKTVLIIGGGLAGLQAGVELSTRGFQVTLLEQSGTPGGKLKSWRDRHFGPKDDPSRQDPAFPGYIREHGIHGVWGFYNNLREYMARYGWRLADMPEDVTIYNFRDKDGTVSSIMNPTLPPPLDKLQFAGNLASLAHLSESERHDFLKLYKKLGTYDHTDLKQRQYLDGIAFVQYGKQLGLSDSLIYKICGSIIDMAYFDDVQGEADISALTMANLFELVAGSPKDWKVNNFVNPTHESFLRPMLDYILSRGGQIFFNTEVTRFERDDVGQIARVVADAVMPEHSRVRRCAVCGNLILDGMDHDDECPFCGAHIEMSRELEPALRAQRSFSADYIICAIDAPAARKLIGANLKNLGESDYFRNITRLHATSLYVINLWFRGRGYWENRILDQNGRVSPWIFPTGFESIGTTMLRSCAIPYGQSQRLVWSNEFPDRDVTIIETQCAKPEQFRGMSRDEITQKVYAELKILMPDLPEPESSWINKWYNYTAFRVGDEMNRPTIQSPIDNLLFIGDLVSIPHQAVFMEKTNVSAKMATNLLLEKAGLKQGRITILPSHTPSASTTALRAVSDVYLDGGRG
jgi:uncharacterized protein with NAD-binding domain and iron-sulfur cluster